MNPEEINVFVESESIDKNLSEFNRLYIDSAKFIIPLERSHGINKERFNLKKATVTLNEKEQVQEYLYKFKTNSIKIPFHGGGNGYIGLSSYKGQPTLTVLLNSKFKGANYLKGLNIYDLAAFLEYSGLVDIPLDYILTNTTVVDCDYTINAEMSDSDFEFILKGLRPLYIPKQSGIGMSKADKKSGYFLSCSKRQQATIANPFIKFYSKKHEAADKQENEFYLIHGIDIQKVKRVEFTMKNKSFFEAYFKHDNKLKNVFGLQLPNDLIITDINNAYELETTINNEFKSGVLFKVLIKHFILNVTEIKKKLVRQNLNIEMIFFLLHKLETEGVSLDQLKHELQTLLTYNFADTRQKKNKYKTKVSEVFKIYQLESANDNKYENLNSILKSLEVGFYTV